MDADPRDLVIAELRALVAQLEQRIAQITSTNERLVGRVRELERKLAAAEAESARQAAPFRVDPQRRIPPSEQKRPGRKPGHPGSFRTRPETIDERVRVPLQACPRCGGPVTKVRPRTQWIVEIPPLRPITTELATECGCCARCGRVSSTHEMQSSAAEGAAGTHLGPRALALATLLNKSLCLPMRKTCRVLKDLLGLSLSPGGLSQAMARVSDRVEEDWNGLIAAIRSAPAAYLDETGWWIKGRLSWLWVAASDRATLFLIDSRRSRDVVTETMGERFPGVVVSDCLAAYERLDCRMQKCLAHHLRAVRKQLEESPESPYLLEMKGALKEIVELARSRGEPPEPGWSRRRRQLDATLDRLLAEVPKGKPEQRVFNRIAKRRGSLTTCLDVPQVDATNNRAERALRPAVIARKLSAGNRSDAGAVAFQRLMSLGVTWGQQGLPFDETLAPRLRLINFRPELRPG